MICSGLRCLGRSALAVKSVASVILIVSIMSVVCCLAIVSAASAAEITFEKQDNGDVVVKADGKLFTRYILKSETKPILYPVIGPSGAAMTRQFPLEDALPSEKSDHPHQRSVWFTHGDVNGLSFWHEAGSFGKNRTAPPYGRIIHRGFDKCDNGEIIARNDWVTPADEVLCKELQKITFGASDTIRWIDWTSTITAVKDEVRFGDTKEGSFGVRVAGTMKVDSKLGGQIVNSDGLTNGSAWGKPAAWVDYYGPVEGKTVGLAILNHPASYGYPTHWHVRTYGLFAANPFGLSDFYGKDSGKNGTLTLKKDESFTVRYRIILHDGDTNEGKIADEFETFKAL